MRSRIHHGPNEIGGSCFEVEALGTRKSLHQNRGGRLPGLIVDYGRHELSLIPSTEPAQQKPAELRSLGQCGCSTAHIL